MNITKSALTYEDVAKTTLDLIAANGQTTTLDVKQELRTAGFYATQRMVSNMMNELYEDSRVSFMDGGQYRIYSWFSITTDASAIDYDQNKQPSLVDPPKTIADVMVLDDEESGCWICFHYDYTDEKMFVDGSVSRNVARAYCKAEFGDYNEIAANRSKM